MLIQPVVSLVILSYLLRNAYKTCGFLGYSLRVTRTNRMKPVVFLVFESSMSLRHSCQPFGEHQVAEEGRRKYFLVNLKE